MTQRSAAPQTQASGPPRAVGRAQVWPLQGGGELWRLPRGADAIATRLVRLGAQGVGDFADGDVDEEGPWLVRGDGQPTLDVWWHEAAAEREAVPWPEALAVFADVADALAACESHSLFVGSLSPRAVVVRPLAHRPRAVLRADALVHGLVGAHEKSTVGSPEGARSRWVAPEQAHGASWDAAANRYVLGLLLYRALAGEHPFSGKGLRLGWAEQDRRGPPPFPDAQAHRLPPGLQSFCLRLLEPDAAARPASARAIAERLRQFTPAAAEQARAVAQRPHAIHDGRTPEIEPAAVPPDVSPHPSLLAAEPDPGPRRWRWLWAWLPLALGIGVAALMVPIAPPSTASSTPVPHAAPLSAEQTRPDDCATCHPAHAAQWHGSVMAHAAQSPLFQSLEMLIEEQVGRAFGCPEGAGVLRASDGRTACRDRQSGLPVTGSGGALWCVNCHAPGENLQAVLPPWNGIAERSTSRRPLRDLLPARTMDGISCAFCHQVYGPVQPGNAEAGLYEGNPSWDSTQTGQRFLARPEDAQGKPGIANSGYFLDPASFLLGPGQGREVPGGAHRRPSEASADYLRSSEFCGGCHDVRLFGTDAIAGGRGEHFKRLRNAYSEWASWAADERRQGRAPASCQDCHMSAFPGVCVPESTAKGPVSSSAVALARACPPGTRFESRAPGSRPTGSVATGSAGPTEISTHYLTGVDVPLNPSFDPALIDDRSLDVAGIPRGARQRRDLLLGATFRFELDAPRLRASTLEIPVVIENIGAGHRVPAGFSQEREFWVHLRVADGRGRTVYEVGRVDRGDEDLHDKVFARVNVDDRFVDGQGRPLGLFGADVLEGPDAPQWSPPPQDGGTAFVGRGLINLQNGFLRCVRCIGTIDAAGRCQPQIGQGRALADRYADGEYDPDSGACTSNLSGSARFIETYFPVGALDATRGLIKGPDAIIDTRSAPPGVPLRYTYVLPVEGAVGPFTVTARLQFRAFPPFLLRAFAEYEALQTARGRRPSGPLLSTDTLQRLEVVEISRIEMTVP